MQLSKSRLESFSDGVISIIITIMVLNIPVPQSTTLNDFKQILTPFVIYFVSFIVVGAQWVKHNYLFSICNKISSRLVWINLLYLFFLSLIPYFTKLIIEYPKEVIPAISYDISFLLLMLSYILMQHNVMENMLKDYDEKSIKKIKNRRDNPKHQLVFILIFTIIICLIFYLSFYNPTISIICFVVIPVISSLSSLWGNDKLDKIKQMYR